MITITFPADEIVLIFFVVGSPRTALIVPWSPECSYVSTINRQLQNVAIRFALCLNISRHCLKMVIPTRFCLKILQFLQDLQAFSYLNVRDRVKFLLSLLLSVIIHQLVNFFNRFFISSSFWSTKERWCIL